MQSTLAKPSVAQKMVSLLIKGYPDAKYYLNFSTPIELLAAAIISAQTRDDVVNSVTPGLFRKFRTAFDYSRADPAELAKLISKVSCAQNKARNIISACRTIQEKYRGKVPNKMEGLLELAGIGRKT